MKQYSPFILAFSTMICIVLVSCIKNPDKYPNTPVIEFTSFVQLGDSADFTFTFKDGDGNIGLKPSDTSGQYSLKSNNGEYYNNLYMIYYYKGIDGNFHRFFNTTTNDSQKIYYRIPNITPVGQNKILDGEIKVRLDPPYFFPGQTPKHSVIKFDVYIYDRDLNKSNVITTPEITTGE